MGLVMGMPGNIFAPQQTATRAQAAQLVANMANILSEFTDWDGEEILHYVYRSDVMVIDEPPSYSFTEADGIFTITVYGSNDDIRRLTPGDTFVLGTTPQQQTGLAGHVIDITSQGANTVIISRSPESLEEIFYEFEFQSSIDLLELADEIMSPVPGVEITRNRNTLVIGNLDTHSLTANFRRLHRASDPLAFAYERQSEYQGERFRALPHHSTPRIISSPKSFAKLLLIFAIIKSTLCLVFSTRNESHPRRDPSYHLAKYSV